MSEFFLGFIIIAGWDIFFETSESLSTMIFHIGNVIKNSKWFTFYRIFSGFYTIVIAKLNSVYLIRSYFSKKIHAL